MAIKIILVWKKHAEVLEKLLNRKVTYVNDVMGSAAQNEIKKTK